MDPNRFVAQKQASWNELEMLLDSVQEHGFASLSAEEANRFGRLARRVSSDLATVRSQIASEELERYLNALMAKAFPLLYGETSSQGKLSFFFRRAWPQALRASRGPIAWATLFFLGAAVLAALAYFVDPRSLVFLGGDGVIWFEERVRRSGIKSIQDFQVMAFSAMLITHNIRVAFFAWALGVTFGIGTALILISNGLQIGLFGAIAHKYGHATIFWSLILPHGILELTAIFVAGGAGLVMARALWFPGRFSRSRALRLSSVVSLSLIGGVIAMLIVAGLIEAFFTPNPRISPQIKIIFAFLTLLPLVGFLFPLFFPAPPSEPQLPSEPLASSASLAPYLSRS